LLRFVFSDVDEELEEERLRILQEAFQLKEAAAYFLHPETPVPSCTGARCFFDRPSAPRQLSVAEADEECAILDDAKALKIAARNFLHPELSVVVSDPTVYGRNFYSRYNHLDDDTLVDTAMRDQILQDTVELKKLAKAFLHPEASITTEDPTMFGRNYFSRPAAPESLDAEKEAIFDDLKGLKKLAIDYLHPELPVRESDPCCRGRNYFSRYASVEQESLSDTVYRSEVMGDLRAFKEVAVDFLHPERPVVANDPSLFARNYFGRFSAVEQESLSDSVVRDAVMKDLKDLKQFAKDYLHPEIPTLSDPTSFARNFFTRPTAPVDGMREERELILKDMQALKALAVDFLHPERSVVTTDPFAFGRNYFSRMSAVEVEDADLVAERELIMTDIISLKEQAASFLHPENAVVQREATAFGRNYFSRWSAHVDYDIDVEETDLVLQDAVALKQYARHYLHPEHPVATDHCSFGRNYFSRFSAPEMNDEELHERDLILEDMKALKKLAVDYLHPEIPIATTDISLSGRNYFSRFSAPDCNEEESRERSLILQDAKALKKLAVDFLHPELHVTNTDPASLGRNYFNRFTAPETDVAEREKILNDTRALKKLAVDYLHPELPVTTTDPFSMGRNYFDRVSAPENPDEDLEELEMILNDARALKKLAVDYLHPELPVTTTDPFSMGRNYFDRFSAPENPEEDLEELEMILNDARALKKLAVDYLHPEEPVVTTDPSSLGRNYFDRASANAHYYMIHTFPAHDDDYEDSHHHEHLDHFGMDDEMALYEDVRHELSEMIYHGQQPVKAGSEEQGNLSRSPSSIMLFDLVG
jgi:hypothetical protein